MAHGRPTIEVTRCTGCGRCVAACCERLFTLETAGFRKHAHLKGGERCTLCGRCLEACPVGALGMGEAGAAPDDDLPRER